MELQLRNLQADYLSSQKRFDQTNHASDFKKVELGLEGLLSIFYDLKNSVEPFQQLMRTAEAEVLSINEVLRTTISLMQPLLREHKTKIELKIAPELPPVSASRNRLHQVFLNIILNAVQQMALKPDGAKILSITTASQELDKERPINLHFTDTGPGIHRRLWEKIFELGFTTRSNGTGQGLYIARSLIESLGGKLVVAQSIIAIGTTFLVDLPDVSCQGEGHE
jgi:signal transduction histidine kinase